MLETSPNTPTYPSACGVSSGASPDLSAVFYGSSGPILRAGRSANASTPLQERSSITVAGMIARAAIDGAAPSPWVARPDSSAGRR
jgi:hypothetical protein